MTFLWPEMLWLLLIVPALVAGYFYILRRKQESAIKYASLSMVKQAIGAGHRLRRHIPPLLFLRRCPTRRVMAGITGNVDLYTKNLADQRIWTMP